MIGAPRGQIVVLAVVVLSLAGCQCSTDYGTPCTMTRADGGTIVYGDVTPGADVLATNATECTDGVCLRQGDAGVGAPTDPVIGYCTGDCVSAADCPSAKGHAPECIDVVAQAVPGIPQGIKYCAYPISP